MDDGRHPHHRITHSCTSSSQTLRCQQDMPPRKALPSRGQATSVTYVSGLGQVKPPSLGFPITSPGSGEASEGSCTPTRLPELCPARLRHCPLGGGRKGWLSRPTAPDPALLERKPLGKQPMPCSLPVPPRSPAQGPPAAGAISPSTCQLGQLTCAKSNNKQANEQTLKREILCPVPSG